MDSRVLGIVPARGGSTRIPEKNIREVAGKPLIAHTIEQCAAAAHLDETIISTDSEKIKSVAEAHGGKVPFDRPPSLATDTAPVEPTVTHALEWFETCGTEFDVVCLLPVTCPLRTAGDIDGAIERLRASDAESVVGVSEYLAPPQWAVAEDEDGFLYDYFDLGVVWPTDSPRSQDVEALKHPNGAIFVTTVSTWHEYESFYTDRTIGYELPPERGFDIDEPWELELVRALMEEDAPSK